MAAPVGEAGGAGLSVQGWTSVLVFSKLLLVTATQLVRNQSDHHFCRVEWESSLFFLS